MNNKVRGITISRLLVVTKTYVRDWVTNSAFLYLLLSDSEETAMREIKFFFPNFDFSDPSYAVNLQSGGTRGTGLRM